MLVFTRHLPLNSYRIKAGRDLYLTRIGTLPKRYKKDKSIFKEMIIMIDNGISGMKGGHENKLKVVESVDFNSERGLKE